MKNYKKAAFIAGLLGMVMSAQVTIAQRALDFMQIQGNSEELFLRIIPESDAISAGNGVLKVQLPDGSAGAADLVPTSDPDASELRIQTPYGTMAWRKETFYGKAYGGSSIERIYALTQGTDGGIALCGYTDSWGAGSSDFLFFKTSEDGTFEWGYAMGFSDLDGGYSILTTNTGGYFISGYYRDASYDSYAFIYHTDENGSVLNSGIYGSTGESSQRSRSAIQASDNNFVIFGGVSSPSSLSEIFVIKIAQWTGTTLWARVIGTSNFDYGMSIVQRDDDGFVGTGNMGTPYNPYNMYLLYMDQDGNEELSLAIGGSDNDLGNDVIKAGDGNYVLAGSTASIGAGFNDFYILKVDQDGNQLWSSAIGGASPDAAYAIVEAADGGYLVCGETSSYGSGSIDMWLIKTDDTGNPEWSWAFGGSSQEYAYDLFLDDNGCIYVCGATSTYSAGGLDGLLVKFSPDGKTCLGVEVTPGADHLPGTDKNDLKAIHIGHFNVDRTMLPSVEVEAHCKPMKLDADNEPLPIDGIISITPTVTTICDH